MIGIVKSLHCGISRSKNFFCFADRKVHIFTYLHGYLTLSLYTPSPLLVTQFPVTRHMYCSLSSFYQCFTDFLGLNKAMQTPLIHAKVCPFIFSVPI